MKTVSLLCYLGRRVVFIMAWIIHRLSPFTERVRRPFWRTLGLIWSGMKMIGSVVQYLAIRWRWSHGSPTPEIDDRDKLTEGTEQGQVDVEVEVEQPGRDEGQHQKADAGKRPAGFDRELDSKRPRIVKDGDESDSEDNYRVKTSDELYCGYDSTWETEKSPLMMSTRRRQVSAKHYKFSRFENAARDMQNFRHGYPSQTRPQRRIRPAYDDKPNLKFYLGSASSKPDGVYIHEFHNNWYGQYDTLEFVHSYIQWLFPLQEPGMNYQASTLTKEEIKEFLQNSTAKANLLQSYKLMLDFYGIKLCDEETGEVQRASNWKERFDNLNSHTHNNLRITRILKCLGTLGYPHYQAPLVRFFLEETLIHRELPDVKDSVLNYFVFAVLDMRQRRSLIKFAYLSYDCKDEFVWCPMKIQMIWSGLSVSKPRKEMKGENDEAWELGLNSSECPYTEDEDEDEDY